MYILHVVGQIYGSSLKLLMEFVDEIDLPLEPLNLPRSQSESDEWCDSKQNHRRRKLGHLLGSIALLRCSSILSGRIAMEEIASWPPSRSGEGL